MPKHILRIITICALLVVLTLPAISAAAEREIKVTIVYDNNPGAEGLKTDWGFACVIEGLGKTVLFDTGTKGDILLANLNALGFDPARIDLVVFSHDHGDHTGGLAAFLGKNNAVDVYMPTVFSGGTKQIVLSAGATLKEIEASMEIVPGLHCTDIVGSDIKEIALYIDAGEGLFVITGCAHPGVDLMVDNVAEKSSRKPYAVIGGFHLVRSSSERITAIIERLKKSGIRYIQATHCTGDPAREMIGDAFGKGFVTTGVGTVHTIK